ncbi:uncharacterized protein LOC121404270 isoform X3 [Drosophila obscura]|uniref:uncharacterized protein LOC121404270 isoform X3 n=1 Tax=Drosophila obscura TaxID=7282 RepID=UPI001BB24B3A|nr:uncharacterized protein LOC121404270 isoform X3 [Drosophila obscura]
MNEIQSVLEVSNLTEKSITDTSEQPNGIQLNVEDENKATEKSSNDNGDKTEPDVLPNKDEQSIALGSEISAPGKSFSHEKDGKASGSSDPPKDLDDDLKMNEIQSVLEVSNLTETSITDTSEQPNGIQLNVEDENKATEKSSNDNGDKTEPDVLPNKDEQSIALGSEISAPGKSFSHEKDGKASGSSDPPKDLDDDLKMNEIQSVLEVSNLTETSITDTSEQPNGIQLNLEDENKATEKSSNDNGDKTEPDVLPNKDEQSIVLGSEISEPGKSFSHEKDGKASGSSDPPKDLDDDLQMNEIQCVSEVSNLTEKSITDTLEQPNGIQLNVEDENKAIEKSINYNGDKTEPDALPNKDVQSIVLGSEFSEPGSSYWKEKDGKVLGSSTPPKDLDDNMKSNEIQSVMEVSNLTDGSITDIVDNLQDDDNGSAVILDKSSKSVQYRPDVNTGLILNESNDVVGSVGDPGILLLSDASYHAAEVVSTQEQVNNTPLKEIQSNTEIELFGNKQNETIEEPCIKKNSYINTNECETKNQFSSDELDKTERETYETIGLETMSGIKLDKVTPKSSRANDAVEQISNQLVLSSHDEPVIRTIGSLQEQVSDDLEEGEIIVYNQLQRNETRESSAQSDSVVFGDVKSEIFQIKDCNSEEESARAPLIRHYTIAGDNARSIFRSVTREDTINDIEIGTKDLMTASSIISTNSLFLDDEISENIRKKIMAFSLSETDSDCIDPRNINKENFDIDTAMAMDTLGTSTETESTIVSAATKIQAGARGFLTRRRMRRASAGTKSSTQETKASFGNAAISESFERLIEEEAAKKIQSAYRIHTRKRKGHNRKMEGISLESNLAARRQKLQRGDALRNDSTPEDDNISLTNGGHTQKHSKSQRNKEKGCLLVSIQDSPSVLKPSS